MSFIMRVPESGIVLEAPNDGWTFVWDASTRTWTYGPGGGGGGAVDSVFGRTGVVIAVTGDYDSDQIDNLSGVAGLSVSDALDELSNIILALAASDIGNDSEAPGTTVADALTNVRDVPNFDVATTGNVALTGTPANIDTGVTLVSGSTRILVWQNTDPNENAGYIYNSAGAWTLDPNWSEVSDYRVGQPFEILGGDLYGGRIGWVKLAPTTVGSSPVIFNVGIEIATPIADGQTLQYRAETNELTAAGIKTYQLSDDDETVGVDDGSCMQLNEQLTQARTITLENTSATDGWAITFDIRVVLAFNLTIENALGQTIRIFAAGRKWYGACVFSEQWQALPFQEAT